MSENELKPKDTWVIGRAQDCDLVVPDAPVSSHHCRLTHQAGGFTLEDLGSTNGTYVNGVRIPPRESVSVQHGTRVTLGGQVPMPWPIAPAAPAAPVEASSPRPDAAPGSTRLITIGRAPDSVVQIDLPIVSWNHAVIREENGLYVIEDLNSTNGTAIGELSNRIQRSVLDPSDEVYFGSYKIAARQLLSLETKVEIGEAAFQTVSFSGNSMEAGRDPNCDIPLDFPMVSWRHARLTRTPEGILVEDLGSRNGTYLNGVRVTGKVLALPGQEIGLGSVRFQLMENGQLAQRDYNGKVTIEAKDIVVHAPNGKRLLDPVSLTVFPYELVALMGPAGAGKTTLLKALNGYTRPVRGTVLFRGQSLYDYYDLYRHMMGYVPQDDIVHPQLTVRQALYFSARLRTDLTDAEIDARTQKVLEDLGIPDKIDTVIGSPEKKTLSGGQRKRVNIGLELITDTPVLFLDEPTSGLSSYDAESVVDLLKDLSKTGKTILTTIHQPSLKVYKQFDDLLMVSRDKGDKPGALVYFGPAYPDSIQFFNPTVDSPASTARIQSSELNPEMLFSGMNEVPDANRTETWRQRFLASKYQQEFVANRSGKQPAATDKTGEEKPRRQFGLGQWIALVKRNVIVRLQDRAQTAILLAQAPLFALLVAIVNYPLRADHFDEIAQKLPIAHFLMVVAAIWFGCNNAARDIVGEWTIYKRERMVTLKLLPYIFSKMAVLMALCIFQCGSMLAIVYLICGLHSNFLYDFLVLLLSSLIGAGLGLSISAVSKTTESAIAMLPLVLLPIIALGGGMRPIYLMPNIGQVISAVIPSRWSYEANLLHEASASQWGTSKVPDYTCNITLPQAPGGSQPQMPPMASMPPGSSMPSGASMPPGSSMPPGAFDPADLNPSLNIQGDPAEGSIPAYLISFIDPAGTRHTCRASADEQYPRLNPIDHAVSNRHRFRDSVAVLCAMLLVLVAGVIAILRKRDSDPQ
ncbi:MAG: FHA domain-containing protein [Terracidiphilus sp.]|jgi:ABC-type multidrug transport system ATPase subunit/ABC-type multidrug transport system permease subunit